MANLVKFINKNPKFLHKFLYNIIPFHYRYGKEYKKTLKYILKTEKQDYDYLKKLQFEKLKKILIHAYENTDYYYELFEKNNFDPYSFKHVEEIKKIPILTKEIIRENFDKLIDRRIDRNKIKIIKTSGSTGEPLKIAITDEVFKREAAYISRSYLRHDCKLYYQKEIKLRSYVPSSDEEKFKIDHELKRLYMSPFHINDENIQEYIKEIDNFGAKFISAYASSAYLFSLICEKNNVKPKNIKYIHTTSEKLPLEWKEHIEKTLNVKVLSHYGMVEKVCHFYQCDICDGYHESMEYGFTEFLLDWDTIHGGKTRPKIYANMIATGFLNEAMPLIRYELSDLALLQFDHEIHGINKLLDKNKCNLGSAVYVQDFIGRTGDFLISNNGTKIPPVNFFTLMCKEVAGIKMFQIIQKKENIVINIVPENFSEQLLFNIKNKVMNGMNERLGINEYIFNFIQEIKRDEKTSKIRPIINEVV